MLELIFLRDADAASVFDALEAIGYRATAFVDHDADPPRHVELTDDPFVNTARMGNGKTPIWYWFDFRVPDRRTRIRLVFNGRLGVSHLELVGPEAAALRSALEALPHDDPAQLCARATGADLADRVQALFQLALAKGPIPEPHVLRLVRAALVDERRLVRTNAIYATAYFEWPAVVPLLRELIAREPDPELVARAQLVADDIDQIRPDRMGSGRYWRIHAELGGRTEQLWIRRFASFARDPETSWLVSSIPRTLEGISLDDIVQIEHADGAVATLSRLEAKSGHHTLRVDATAEVVEPIALAHRLRYEEQDAGCVAIDVPPAIDVATITAALDARSLAWRQTD